MNVVMSVLVLLLLLCSAAWAGNVLLCLSADWMLSLRLGVEAPLSPCFALRTDWGASLFGTWVGDLFCVFHAMPPASPLRLALLVGVPNICSPFSPFAPMVSFGGSVLVGYRFTDRFGMDFRIGAGFPLFFEEGKPMIRDLENMPLDLWPDLTLSAFLRL